MLRRLTCLSVVVLLVVLGLSGEAYARAGSGFSFGNRGMRSFIPPPVTRTAPSPAAPLGGYGSGYSGPGSLSGPSTAPGGFFSGGFGRGLLGGFIGAGLFGLLFGNGFFGGLGGGLSFIGLLVQLGLVFLLVRFVVGLVRGRGFALQTTGSSFGAVPSGAPDPGGVRTSPISIGPADFSTFERRLAEIQAAYGAEDLPRLERLATRQMVDHFATELRENARRGIVNRPSDVRMLQGDLAEAWREPGADYATVAMRYSIVDVNFERATGRLVPGTSAEPQVVTEVWTFARPPGSGPDNWRLSAIQQA